MMQCDNEALMENKPDRINLTGGSKKKISPIEV